MRTAFYSQLMIYQTYQHLVSALGFIYIWKKARNWLTAEQTTSIQKQLTIRVPRRIAEVMTTMTASWTSPHIGHT